MGQILAPMCPFCDDSQATPMAILGDVTNESSVGAPTHSDKWIKSHDYLMRTKTQLNDIFRSLDSDGDGKISKKELIDAIQHNKHLSKMLKGAFHASGFADSKHHKGGMPVYALQLLDEDHDGRISKTEFFEKLYAEANVCKIFNEYDSNEDGKLTKAEFNMMLKEDPEMELLLKRVGVHTDAYVFEQIAKSSPTISCVEFLHRVHLHSKLVDIFEAVDVNGDGKISAEELNEAMGKDDTLKKICEANHVNPNFYTFEQLDTQKQGYITIEEFIGRLKKSDTND